MAHHASAIKRIRSSATKRAVNRYQHKTTRTFIKKLQAISDPTEAAQLYPKVCSLIDKLAKRHIIHSNKAARKKSQLARYVNQLRTTDAPPTATQPKKRPKASSSRSSTKKKGTTSKKTAQNKGQIEQTLSLAKEYKVQPSSYFPR